MCNIGEWGLLWGYWGSFCVKLLNSIFRKKVSLFNYWYTSYWKLYGDSGQPLYVWVSNFLTDCLCGSLGNHTINLIIQLFFKLSRLSVWLSTTGCPESLSSYLDYLPRYLNISVLLSRPLVWKFRHSIKSLDHPDF